MDGRTRGSLHDVDTRDRNTVTITAFHSVRTASLLLRTVEFAQSTVTNQREPASDTPA